MPSTSTRKLFTMTPEEIATAELVPTHNDFVKLCGILTAWKAYDLEGVFSILNDVAETDDRNFQLLGSALELLCVSLELRTDPEAMTRLQEVAQYHRQCADQQRDSDD